MAGDWIKMRVWLARDPQVISMADFLAGERSFMNWLTDPVRRVCDSNAYEHVTRNVTVSVTVVGLLQVWGVANDRGGVDGDDLILSHASLTTLDEVAGVPCFGAAMEHVGWATEDGGSVRFPRFLRNNIPAEDRSRKTAAERQRRYRERNVTVTPRVTLRDNVTVTDRVEESREEKKEEKKDPPTPHSGGSSPLATPIPDSDPEAEKPITPDELAEGWNATVAERWNLPRVTLPLSDVRRRKALARIRERPEVAFWRGLFSRFGQSKFLRGENGREGWRGASFDFVIQNDTRPLQIIEGKYDDGRPQLRVTR